MAIMNNYSRKIEMGRNEREEEIEKKLKTHFVH